MLTQFSLLSLLTSLVYITGLMCAVFALWRSRTPQGATAWIVGLISFPFVVVPLFLVFGRNKFLRYTEQRRQLDKKAQRETAEIENLFLEQVALPENISALAPIARLANQPGLTNSNSIDLLVDGEQTFASMYEAIETAESYVLFQFYIFRDDNLGNKFADLLIKKARAGVKVYFVFDGIGTSISSTFIKKLETASIEVGKFQSSKNWSTRFQINFRNHRKLLVVDGKTAFVGGLNIGDDYLGLWPKIGKWRDTHVRVEGPAALAAQLSFVKDWYWIKEKIPRLSWKAHRKVGGSQALILHTGPADDGEPCLLAHIAMINAAKKRVWIANPYFVPPEGLVHALSLARLRGVEVRILGPSYSDNRWVMYASEVSLEKLIRRGARIYKYKPGFLHQKVMLVDDEFASVGSVNLDSRSIFINFEITAISLDKKFVSDVANMLEADFHSSSETMPSDLIERPFARQLLTRAASLMAPIL